MTIPPFNANSVFVHAGDSFVIKESSPTLRLRIAPGTLVRLDMWRDGALIRTIVSKDDYQFHRKLEDIFNKLDKLCTNKWRPPLFKRVLIRVSSWG